MSNGQVWKTRKEIDCHYVIYYMECKMCNEKETYQENNKRQYERIKVRINQQMSDCKTGDSTCKFLRQVYDFGIKNNCLEEQLFSINTLLRLNKSDRLETIKKHFRLKGYDTMNTSGRN